jgi:hypothetical protein
MSIFWIYQYVANQIIINHLNKIIIQNEKEKEMEFLKTKIYINHSLNSNLKNLK